MNILILAIAVFGNWAFANPGDLVRSAQPGECIPEYPQIKEYLQPPKKGWLYTRVVFQCVFHCKADNGDYHEIVGTQKERFIIEDGTEMVCRGYEKDMVWVETFGMQDRWGYYTLGKRRPFKASRSKIPELVDWAQN